MYPIELYKMDGMFCAEIVIDPDSGSAYCISGETPEECSIKIARFFEDYGKWY